VQSGPFFVNAAGESPGGQSRTKRLTLGSECVHLPPTPLYVIAKLVRLYLIDRGEKQKRLLAFH